MSELRLGDVIDDYCIKCRRVTNHSIVSILNGEAAKVRCRTCYHDHDYRHEEVPPTKKELKKAEMLAAALASGTAPGDAPAVDGTAPEPDMAIAAEPEIPADEPVDLHNEEEPEPAEVTPITKPAKARKAAPKATRKAGRK